MGRYAHRLSQGMLVVWGLVLGMSSRAPAEVDYGNITSPPGGPVHEAARVEGVSVYWLATYEGVPVYQEHACVNQLKKLAFRRELLGLWRDDKAVLLGEGSDGGRKITSIVGYVRQRDVIEARCYVYHGLRTTTGIHQKALVVHRWSEGRPVTAEAVLRDRPDRSADSVGCLRLFDILFVYAFSGEPDDPNGFCLVATTPHCEVADPQRQAQRFLGWLENRRVWFWNQRQAVEYNNSPKALDWRRRNHQPIRFYDKPGDIDGPKESTVLCEEDLEQDAPWAHHWPRYPIVSPGPKGINGIDYWQVGLVGGGLGPLERDHAATRAREPRILIKQHLIDLLKEKGIDPAIFDDRSQHFALAYVPIRLPGSPYDSFDVCLRMHRAEFQSLTNVIATVNLRRVTKANVAEVWRQVINQLTGDFDVEMTYDADMPLSEYMKKILGIPVRTKLLNRSVNEIMCMSKPEIAQQRAVFRELNAKMNNYDNELSPDGSASERHWFKMHGHEYGWIPMEVIP